MSTRASNRRPRTCPGTPSSAAIDAGSRSAPPPSRTHKRRPVTAPEEREEAGTTTHLARNTGNAPFELFKIKHNLKHSNEKHREKTNFQDASTRNDRETPTGELKCKGLQKPYTKKVKSANSYTKAQLKAQCAKGVLPALSGTYSTWHGLNSSCHDFPDCVCNIHTVLIIINSCLLKCN